MVELEKKSSDVLKKRIRKRNRGKKNELQKVEVEEEETHNVEENADEIKKKVKKVKKLLEYRGLQKLPGRCWMEVGRKMYSFVSVDEFNPLMEQIHALLVKLAEDMKEKGYIPQTKGVLYDLETEEKERIVLGHSEKLALAFGLINTAKGEPIRITKNLRLCEDCHLFTKFISKFMEKEILVRDVNRFHRFKNGVCSCGDYW